MIRSQDVPPMAANGAPNGGQVTSQNLTVQLDASNHPVKGVEVQFTTGKGNKGSVFIPMDRYSKPNVIAEVRQLANQLDEVHGTKF